MSSSPSITLLEGLFMLMFFFLLDRNVPYLYLWYQATIDVQVRSITRESHCQAHVRLGIAYTVRVV